MKKFWKIVIICVVALGVLVATCPGKQRHIDAEVKFMRKTLHEQAERTKAAVSRLLRATTSPSGP